MIAIEEPNEVARISRVESGVKRSAEEPVPSESGSAAESDVEKVFCRRGETEPSFCGSFDQSNDSE